MTRATDRYKSPYGRDMGGVVMPRVNLASAQKMALAMRPFETSCCYGAWVPQVETEQNFEKLRAKILGKAKPVPRNYVIYTGVMNNQQGIPLYLYDEDAQQWFECQGILYGRITTQARRRLRPMGGVIEVDERLMKMILYYGYRYVAKCRLERGERRSWRDELRLFVSDHTVNHLVNTRILK